MAAIWERGPYQFCARVRRKQADGKVVSQTKTFESRRAAEEWAGILEGKVRSDEYRDRKVAHDTTLSQACRLGRPEAAYPCRSLKPCPRPMSERGCHIFPRDLSHDLPCHDGFTHLPLAAYPLFKLYFCITNEG